MMNWILNYGLSWIIVLLAFSLISIIFIGYFKFNGNLDRAQFFDYFRSSTCLVRRLSTKLRKKSAQFKKLNLIKSQNKLYSNFKMTSFERKQSFIKHSLDERNRKQNQQSNQHESFIYSSIFSFTKTLINRAPKSLIIKQTNKNQPETSSNQSANPYQLVKEERPPDNKNQLTNSDNNSLIVKKQLPIHNTTSTLSNLNTMSTLNENEDESETRTMCKSVSLQMKDEMKAPRNRLLHQSSSGSSHSSTPNDLFSIAEKGKIGANLSHFRKHKPLLNHKVHQQQATYTELVTQIENHEDAINREYLMHQLNPNQYHSMHYYRRLERQNCINKEDKKMVKQDTSQSNSSTNQNNSNELEHFTNSSSNSSCSECDSLDTEEELTLPFVKKIGPYQSSLRSKHPLKLSSSLDKNFSNFIHFNNLTKQCSSDSNEPMVGLLNENLIKRQLSNGTYLKLSDRINDNKLSDKRKRILGRRLTTQNNSFSGSSFNNSFNNSSNNSSFDHDDMLVQFTSHQANSFSSPDNQQFHHFSHYENNSNDTSSSSNSSCGHRHAERTKSLNINNEFNMLNVCDNQNYLNSFDQQDEYQFNSESTVTNCLHVTHAYDPTSRKLKIRIIKLDYVPMRITDCDRYYIKLIILPNKRQKFKTTIKTCSSNQIEYDELFIFNRIPPETIMNLSIKYLLYSVNNESKHRNIGEAIIRFETRKPMQQEDNLIVYLNSLVFNRSMTNQSLNYPNTMKNSASTTSKSITNTANNELSDSSSIRSDNSVESHHSIQLNLPELLIGLAYNATTGRLQVSIIRGSQFKSKPSKPPDTFVKCILLSSAGREMGRNKTTVKKSQPNPVFKQTFAFQVALFQLPDVSLMISVYNKKSMSRKEMIGWFSLGNN